MFKRISFYLLLTSCAFGQNFGFPNNLQVTTVGGGSNGTNGGANVPLVTFTYAFNAVTNTIYVNSNAFPEVVTSQLVLTPSVSTPGYALLNIVGSSQTYQVLQYSTNAGTVNYPNLVGIVPASASFYFTFPDFPGGGATTAFNTTSGFNTSVYGTTSGSFPAGVIATPVTIANGGTGQTTASAARTALGTAGLTDNNTFSGTSNYFANLLTANNVSFSYDGSLTETVTVNANRQLGQILWVDGENGITYMDYTGESGWDLLYTFKPDGVSFGGPDAVSSELNTLDFGDVNSSHRFSIGTNDVLAQGLALPVRYVNGNFTISILDNTVYEISNNAVITLPTALDLQKTDGTSYLPGHLYWLTFLTNGSCTINSTSNQTIGQSALTNFVLSGNGATVALQSNGTNAWNILNSVSGSGVSPVVIITNGWTSPHTWTNTNSFPAQLILQGWTISSISINGTVVGSSALGFEIVPGLRPLDTCSMTYTVGGNAWFRPQ